MADAPAPPAPAGSLPPWVALGMPELDTQVLEQELSRTHPFRVWRKQLGGRVQNNEAFECLVLSEPCTALLTALVYWLFPWAKAAT